MKSDPKDNKITNSQNNDSSIGYKPNHGNESKPLNVPASDANPDEIEHQREIQDTDHEHSYNTPIDESVVIEKTQNSNPGQVHNNNQGANQLN